MNECQTLVIGSTLIAMAEVDDQVALAAGPSPTFFKLSVRSGLSPRNRRSINSRIATRWDCRRVGRWVLWNGLF